MVSSVKFKEEHIKVLRFLVAGGSAALTEYSFFILLTHINLPIILSNTLSFLCGLCVSFLLNKHWVFSAKGDASRQFILYFILATVNLGISNLLIWVFVGKIGLVPLVAKVFVMALIAVWNYAFFSRLIFKNRHLDA